MKKKKEIDSLTNLQVPEMELYGWGKVRKDTLQKAIDIALKSKATFFGDNKLDENIDMGCYEMKVTIVTNLERELFKLEEK